MASFLLSRRKRMQKGKDEVKRRKSLLVVQGFEQGKSSEDGKRKRRKEKKWKKKEGNEAEGLCSVSNKRNEQKMPRGTFELLVPLTL